MLDCRSRSTSPFSRRGRPSFLGFALVATIGSARADDLPAPPRITVLQAKPGTERGFIFVAPKTAPAPGTSQGAEIVDDQGRPVWFHPVSGDDQVADFRVQRYRGEPVLTWWQGQSHDGPGHGEGVDYIVDRSYRVIATVNAGNGLAADTHEFRLTPDGTALIVVYHKVAQDLSSVGGPANGSVYDGIVQEIDVGSGAVLFEWHSLDHVGLDESHAAVPTSAATAYDYFHINSVSLDQDDNLIVDARNTWTVYKVDRRTGEVLWRLAGKKSDFVTGPGVAFAWQHDPEAVDRATLRIFDNEASPVVLPHSRVIWVRRDFRRLTATLVRSLEHPDGLSAGSQGNSQALGNGNTFVGWGQTGRFSEFDAAGTLLFDATVPAGYDTYRAYRHRWHGQPDTRPEATAQRNADGTTTVHAIWNGATEVVRWIVVGGADHRFWPIGSADWNGLDTAIQLTTDAREVAVVAQDRSGRLIGRSAPISAD
jgi:Arylsulfotransferase (ASST)